jgi:hypothetical protein
MAKEAKVLVKRSPCTACGQDTIQVYNPTSAVLDCLPCRVVGRQTFNHADRAARLLARREGC